MFNILFVLLTVVFTPLTYAAKGDPALQPQGDKKQLQTRVLEVGTKLAQNFDPLKNYNVYLVGFHPSKADPSKQITAYHYCNQLNEDFMQCVVFDSNKAQANLTGIEYIISEKLFNQLPGEERKYWHPHNYEILSGQLVAPRVPAAAEKQFMKKKINSYGKTWHIWLTDVTGRKGDSLPLGEPHLAWSFNHDGEIQPELIANRYKQLGINMAEKRKQRQDLLQYAKPQYGVEAITHKFPGPIIPVPGVTDVEKQTK